MSLPTGWEWVFHFSPVKVTRGFCWAVVRKIEDSVGLLLLIYFFLIGSYIVVRITRNPSPQICSVFKIRSRVLIFFHMLIYEIFSSLNIFILLLV